MNRHFAFAYFIVDPFDIWMESIKKGAIFPTKYFSAPAGAIFGRTNIEMTNTITSRMDLNKEYEEEVVREFTKEANFDKCKRKNCRKKC